MEFKQAMELNQNLPQTYGWYAFYLTLIGRFDQAEQMRQRAMQLDPFSVVLNADMGLMYYLERKYDRAIEQNLITLQMDPGLGALAHIPLGASYIMKSMYPQALESFSQLSMKLNTIVPTGHNITIAAMGYGYACSGKHQQAYDMLELLLEKDGEEYVSPFWVAVLYVGLSDYDQALDWLERGLRERDGSMVYLKVMPVFDPVRSHPRFQSILEQTGLANLPNSSDIQSGH